jgi:predicted metal-dependent phosphoesterase TrpH
VRHHVGLEVSYYGRHITGFGVDVPIPDYAGLLPNGLSSEEVVSHIHRHGGLACLAHPPRTDLDGTADALAERRLFGADLMEVAHGGAGLVDRLQLWDRLAARGVIVTGIGVSDAHSAKAGWTAAGGR